MSIRCSLIVAAFALAGCAETCPPPQDALNSKVFDVFGRLVALESDPAPEWPQQSFPLDGLHQWEIAWNTNTAEADIQVTIDGQASEIGRGYFDDVECGNFSMAFKLDYFAVGRAEHLFAANARLVVWPEGIDGFVDFESSWTAVSGAIGSTNGSVQLSTIAGPGSADPG